MFTQAEKERRHKAVNQMIIRENLRALLIYGDYRWLQSVQGIFATIKTTGWLQGYTSGNCLSRC